MLMQSTRQVKTKRMMPSRGSTRARLTPTLTLRNGTRHPRYKAMRLRNLGPLFTLASFGKIRHMHIATKPPVPSILNHTDDFEEEEAVLVIRRPLC